MLNMFSITFFCLLLVSCTATRVNSKIHNPPTKSFVKIIHNTHIFSCVDKNDKNCPIGSHSITGSGMAVQIVPGKMTVLTAGHVCDSQPSEKVKDSRQLVTVLDYKGNIHQAWPVLVSFNDQMGASDLCILWVPSLEVTKVHISNRPPIIGDEIYYVGAPAGVYHPPTVPIFKGIYSGPVNSSSSLATFPVIGGASGSAALNFDNKIIGVVFARNARFHHISLLSNYKSFTIFIDMAKQELNKLP